MRLLLAADANLEIQDDDGDTALHYSAFGQVKHFPSLVHTFWKVIQNHEILMNLCFQDFEELCKIMKHTFFFMVLDNLWGMFSHKIS